MALLARIHGTQLFSIDKAMKFFLLASVISLFGELTIQHSSKADQFTVPCFFAEGPGWLRKATRDEVYASIEMIQVVTLDPLYYHTHPLYFPPERSEHQSVQKYGYCTYEGK